MRRYEILDTLRDEYMAPIIEFSRELEDVAWVSDALQNVVALIDDLYLAHREGRPVVVNEYALLSELLLAMDMAPFPAETVGFLGAILQSELLEEFIDSAHNAGVPTELCSLDKVILGMHLRGEMPEADFSLAFSTPCDSAVAAYQMVPELTGKPSFFIDVPPEHGDRVRDYISRQIRDFIGFAERTTGRKLDWDVLKEKMETSNRALEILLENNEFRRRKPCPGSGKILAYQFMILAASQGLERGVGYQRVIREHLKRNVESETYPTDHERIRIIWPAIPTLFDMDIGNWMEEEHGAVVVMDLVGCVFIPMMDTSSEQSMLDSLADKIMDYNMVRHCRGSLSLIFEDLFHLYNEYQADCIIFANHLGCKHTSGFMGMLRQEAKRRGIPALIFDIDGCDARVTSSEQVIENIDRFFKTYFG